jgi:16S rRNA (cytosine967-C5)-methyltransferase
MDIRFEVFKLLCDIEKNSKFSNLALDARIKKEEFSPKEKASLTALLYGVIERSVTLDYFIACAAKRSIDSIDTSAKNAIRIGLYEIIYQNTAEHAAVNEAVKLGRSNGERGFINAVLRNFIKYRQEFESKANSLTKAKRLSIKHSVSIEIARILRNSYGEEKADSVLLALNTQRGITLRVNTEKISCADYLSMLKSKGIEASPCRYSAVGVNLKNSMPLKDIPGFNEGYFFVEDEASQLCASLAAPSPDGVMIDTCSCPGSKSFAAALHMKNRGKIYSFDARQSKLSLIDSGAQRLGIKIIESAHHDGTTPRGDLIGKADAVLCDVPCSGIGVISKKPDLRAKTSSDISILPQLQYDILSASSAYLKPGGKLIYSTCTLNSTENEENVIKFRKEHPNFVPHDFSFVEVRSKDGMLTLFPDEHGCDGFFISMSVLKKDI